MTQKEAVKSKAILGPFESMSMPPKRGTTTFGNAYKEYSKLNYA